MSRNTRIGMFTLPRVWVLDPDESVRRVMSQCIVLDTVARIISDEVEYFAICDRWFRSIGEGEVVPLYEWYFSGDGYVEAREVVS